MNIPAWMLISIIVLCLTIGWVGGIVACQYTRVKWRDEELEKAEGQMRVYDVTIDKQNELLGIAVGYIKDVAKDNNLDALATLDLIKRKKG